VFRIRADAIDTKQYEIGEIDAARGRQLGAVHASLGMSGYRLIEVFV
jgi:hypothetical protein